MIRPGLVVDEKYQLSEKVGRGGMGTVFKAQHLRLGREVAIKFLHPEYALDENHKARFIREAKVSSRLSHENAITIHDFGEFNDHLYIVMEFLDGKPLHRVIGRGKPLGRERALVVSYQVADVLVTAHKLSLVHRDLKPENIMLQTRADGSDRAVVVDFGLAFLAESDQASMTRMTREGVVAGTPAFISPEQAQGRNVGPPTDIYSFGCVMYEMFTGTNVFLGTDAIGLLNKHMFVPPVSPREAYPEADVPIAIDTLIMNMLEKAPEDRPNAIEVHDWIGKILGNETPRERGRPEALLSPRRDRSVTQAPDQKTARLNSPIASQATTAATGSKIAILIDDIPTEWIVSLATAGFQCHQVTLDDVRDFRVAVIHDATVDQIRDLADEMTLVAVVTDSEIETMTDLMKAGAFDVLSEPFELSDFVKKVERAWRKRKRNET